MQAKRACPQPGDSTYPTRPKNYDREFYQALVDSEAVNAIGADGVVLLLAIMRKEDHHRWSRAIDYWNPQLMAATGLKSIDTLARVRDRCVDAGWLKYQPGSRSKPAVYWVCIPREVEPRTPREQPRSCGSSTANSRTVAAVPAAMCGTSIPSPLPKNPPPSPTAAVGPALGDVETQMKQDPESPSTDPRFVAFWAVYPRREKKREAARRYAALNPTPELQAMILAAIATQKRSGCLRPIECDGRSLIPLPAKWLDDARWEDVTTDPDAERKPIHPDELDRLTEESLKKGKTR
jgi:hypothetical protein